LPTRAVRPYIGEKCPCVLQLGGAFCFWQTTLHVVY
jgi:hypothetical protein